MLIHPGRVGRVGPGVTAAAGSSPVLDGLSASAAAAYSLRKLRSAYAGSAIRVRRSSDNAEADIGFTGNNFDTAALLAHVGVGDGFVTTWYDQSGNSSRNLGQSTAGSQLRIALSGAVETGPNSRPVVRALGAQHMTAASWGSVAQPFTRNYVIDDASTGHVLNSLNSTPNTAEYFSAATTIRMYAGSDGPSNSLTATEAAVLTSIYNGASSQQAKNGTLSSAANPSTNAFAGITIASSNGSLAFTTALFCELVIFASALSTGDRQALERDQGAYYGITVA